MDKLERVDKTRIDIGDAGAEYQEHGDQNDRHEDKQQGIFNKSLTAFVARLDFQHVCSLPLSFLFRRF